MPLIRAFQKLIEGGLLTPLAPKPVPQPVPPRFRIDLHYSYHQELGHDTDHCNALRHDIQDLIDQGLVNLGQPSVTTNPLPAHSTHAAPSPPGDIHHMDLIEDDSIHMLRGMILIPDEASFQLTHSTPLVIGCEDTFVSFTLWPENDDSEGKKIQIVTHSRRIAQPPPLAVRPFKGAASHEEVRRKDDEVLRQLQSTQARISIWSLLASSSTHRDALIRALSQIRVETTTTPEGLIHMMMAGPLALYFGPSTQTVRAYDSTKKEVMGTLVITIWSTRDMFASSELVLHISHNKDDLFLTGFTFDEIQTLEIEDFCRDFVAMSFDQHSSTVVLDMMRGMTFLPGMGLERRQLGPNKFIAIIDHDTTFGLGISLADYFVRGSEIRYRLEEIDSVVHIDRETELDDGVIVDPTEMIDGVVPHDEYRDEMDMMTVTQITSIV
ncbi:hypothetical protein CK203_112030 [Vitis vinifera]|uniref:Uncharacterized protein n=1 Tax=Vitis vinifera TaxID=29760 RepID=A0A438CAK1_VITVI|nr:hypothetical protein CK203_112030 [Vitis vinifera]